MKRIFSFLEKYRNTILFFIYESIFLLFLDFFNHYLVIGSLNVREYVIKELWIFNFIWISLFLIVIYLLKPKLRKIFTLIINILFSVLSIINYFMYSYFHTIFSFKDLFLSGEGLAFVNSIFEFINLKFVLFICLCLFFIVLVFKSRTKYTYKIKSLQSLIIIILMVVLIGGRSILKNSLSNVSDGWDSTSILTNNSNYYVNWIEPARLIRFCGTYEYFIKDFYHSFLKKENAASAKEIVDEFIDDNSNSSDVDVKYNGIFKGKNLLFVMMESMDDWMINEDVTPTISEMMKHGFNFVNHYSPGYVTGDTANTEFIANTGMYPSINKLSPNYAYVSNSYPYSIASLFKNMGYTVNSFHRSLGFIYNRSAMHLSFGYEKYYNYMDMGINEENLDLDSYIIKNGYKYIVSDDKFMSFIITYSAHDPFTYDKIECQTNLEDIKEMYPNIDNEEELCSYSAARETDNMFKNLLENLEKDDLLDDTVIVAFSDHRNKDYSITGEDDMVNKTAFFVYDSSMAENKISTITSSINILPTVINLFDIDTEYLYPGYDALNYEGGYVIFRDYTYYDGKELKGITSEQQKLLEYSSSLLISDYYKK